MTSLGQTLAKNINDQGKIKRVIATKTSVQPLVTLTLTNVDLANMPKIIQTRDVSGDSIWGTAVWGTDDWDGTYTYGMVVQEIINPNKVWRTYLTSLENAYWTDTVNTTATVTAGSDIDFTSGEEYHTNALTTSATNLVDATLTIGPTQITNISNLSFYLSADGGSTYEAITINTVHNFTATGTSLKLKVVASGNATISIRNTNNIVKGWSISYT